MVRTLSWLDERRVYEVSIRAVERNLVSAQLELVDQIRREHLRIADDEIILFARSIGRVGEEDVAGEGIGFLIGISGNTAGTLSLMVSSIRVTYWSQLFPLLWPGSDSESGPAGSAPAP